MRMETILDFNSPELDIFARLNENGLARINEPKPGIFVAESAKVIKRALTAGYEPVSLLIAEELLETGEKKQTPARAEVSEVLEEVEKAAKRTGENIRIFTASTAVLSQITGYELTRGILCAFKRRKLPDIGEIYKKAGRIAVLEDINNPTNIGAIIRSAAALGVDGLILTGVSTDPLYRRAARVSMGTVFEIPWTICSSMSTAELLERLKISGFTAVAMALEENSLSLEDKRLKECEYLAIVLGNEGEGLRKETIQACDYTVMIPMSHGVDSLNVAAASAVAFWELRKPVK